MKKFEKGFLFLSIVTLLLACEENESYSQVRRIENNSTYDLLIQVYSMGSVFEELSIPTGQIDEISTTCNLLISTTRCEMILDWTDVADSAVLIFDSSRKITYCTIHHGDCFIAGKKNVTNLLDTEYSYKLDENKKKSKIKSRAYTFEVTDDDYDNALSINN